MVNFGRCCGQFAGGGWMHTWKFALCWFLNVIWLLVATSIAVAHVGWRLTPAGCANWRWRQSASGQTVVEGQHLWLKWPHQHVLWTRQECACKRVSIVRCVVSNCTFGERDSLTAALSSSLSRWTLRSPAVITGDVGSSRSASSSKNRSVARDDPD